MKNTDRAGGGWDRAHILSLPKDPAALMMIRRYAPVRRWSDAVRPVTGTAEAVTAP